MSARAHWRHLAITAARQLRYRSSVLAEMAVRTVRRIVKRLR